MTVQTSRRRQALAAAFAVLALTAGACSDDGGDGGDDDEGAATTTGPGATETTQDGATTTTPTDPACPAPDAPEPEDALSADVDGDGAADEVGILQQTGELVLRVDLAAGGRAALVLPTVGIDGSGLIGPADVDGDGAAELWVRTGSGASAAIVGLVRFVDCKLVQVNFQNGDPAELPVGGSVGTSAGLSCEGSVDPAADLTTYLAGNVGEETYEVTATEYTLDGTTLTQLGSATSTVTTSDPAFGRYVTFSCGNLAL